LYHSTGITKLGARCKKMIQLDSRSRTKKYFFLNASAGHMWPADRKYTFLV